MQSPSRERTPQSDLARMERWTAWVIRLTTHSASKATDATARVHLEGAKEDAIALREALSAAASGWLDGGQTAIVRSIYELWDANHDRTEKIAAAVDPEWHRRWKMRSDGSRPDATVYESIEHAFSQSA